MKQKLYIVKGKLKQIITKESNKPALYNTEDEIERIFFDYDTAKKWYDNKFNDYGKKCGTNDNFIYNLWFYQNEILETGVLEIESGIILHHNFKR